jgi:hypothetical protein
MNNPNGDLVTQISLYGEEASQAKKRINGEGEGICFLTLNWIPLWGKINFKNAPTRTLESLVNQYRRQGDEKGGRLRTNSESISH